MGVIQPSVACPGMLPCQSLAHLEYLPEPVIIAPPQLHLRCQTTSKKGFPAADLGAIGLDIPDGSCCLALAVDPTGSQLLSLWLHN